MRHWEEPPCTLKTYVKKADLSSLRVIGTRAFVQHERYTKNLSDRAFEGKRCCFSRDSKAYRVYNPATRNVVEGKNTTFTETLAYSMLLNVPDDDLSYEGDILSVTSVLGGVVLPHYVLQAWDENGYRARSPLHRCR